MDENSMNIHEELELEDCPYCRGMAVLEEEGGWCWYVMCTDCGSRTAPIEYKTPDERLAAARHAARIWNMGKAVREGAGE